MEIIYVVFASPKIIEGLGKLYRINLYLILGGAG